MYPVMIVGSIYVALEYWVLLPTLEFYIPTIRFVRPRLAKCDLKQNMCQTRTAYFLSISGCFGLFPPHPKIITPTLGFTVSLAASAYRPSQNSAALEK